MPPWLKRIASEPLHHFLLLGLLIFALYVWIGDRDERGADHRIVISAADVLQMSALWEKRWSRPPTAKELEGLVQARIREELLYREAVALGLDRDDTIVRRRMAQKMEFLFEDVGDLIEPDESQLRAYLAENPERFREPARMTLSLVYVSPDRRGEAARADAERILAELRATSPEGEPGEHGDPFPLAGIYRDVDTDRLGRELGRPFAEAVAELPTGEWQGPVESSYGFHLAFIHRRTPARMPDLAEVEKKVRGEWSSARRRDANETIFAGLLERYEVVVEAPETARTAAGANVAP